MKPHTKVDFHSECRAVALEMFGKEYGDLDDSQACMVSETVKRRNRPDVIKVLAKLGLWK